MNRVIGDATARELDVAYTRQVKPFALTAEPPESLAAVRESANRMSIRQRSGGVSHPTGCVQYCRYLAEQTNFLNHGQFSIYVLKLGGAAAGSHSFSTRSAD